MTAISETTRRYVLGVLVVVYTFNFIDRQILAILFEPIKAELGLSDADLGFLTGFAFAAFYVTLGIPIARFADRGNRRNLIAAALVVWSAMTALCGLAQNFWHLLVARIGVGVGEAGCSPPAHAMISDYYPAERRATALGIYGLGIPLGILFGFLAGGWINEFFGWRAAFFVVGIPGILFAVVVRLTVREPPRGLAEGRSSAVSQPSIVETARFLWSRPSFRHIALGGSLISIVGYAFNSWVPSFFVRSFGMTTGELGTWLGLILGIPGGIGIVLGGYLADRLGERDCRWRMWVVAVALLAMVPFSVAAFLADSAAAALALFVIPALLSNVFVATTFAQAQGLVGLRMRAVTAAILLLALNISGLGLGPYVVGLLSDALAARFGSESLRYALLSVSLVSSWAACHYFIAGRHLGADLNAAPP